MNFSPSNRLTPWVARLIIANAVVLLLLLTIFTSPALVDGLQFNPGRALQRPWTFFTYMFVHAGLLHLLMNMLMLFVFGGPVEARMGSRSFILYYLFCGVGAAIFSMGLSGIMHVSPFVGASGAILGVALAFATYWPDAELILFPIPIPMRARTFVGILIALDVLGALYFNDGVAHLAHVGGALFGYLFFRLHTLARRRPHAQPRTLERVVMVQSGSAESERRTPLPSSLRPRRRPDADPVAAEVDRVLDKISEKGMSSLTPAERRFLDEVAKQKKQDN